MLEVKVCVGTGCHLKGAYNVVSAFQMLIEENNLHDKVNLGVAFCMGDCQNGVCVSIGDELFGVKSESASSFFRENILSRVA